MSASTGPFGFGSSLVGSAPVGNGPSLLAVDPATHTIYVANGENNKGPVAGGDTVSVIDARRCNAGDVSDCKGPWPTITVGNGTLDDLPSGIAIDQKTDTVYVTNVGDEPVSVVNGETCNAEHARGCGQTPAEIPVGLGPLAIYADPANHTLYVANLGNGSSTTVSLIDSATCNATDLAGCPSTPPPPAICPDARATRPGRSRPGQIPVIKRLICTSRSIDRCAASTSAMRRTRRWSSSTRTSATEATSRRARRSTRRRPIRARTQKGSCSTPLPRRSTPPTRSTTTSR